VPQRDEPAGRANGLALPTTLLVRDDAPYTGKNGSHFAWTVSPYTTGKSAGVGVTGIF
jgi:hypothetical protein